MNESNTSFIGTSASDKVLSILLPVRNEGMNLKIMLKFLSVVVDVPHEVVAIYDRSEDTSVPILQELQNSYPTLKIVHNTLGPGVINAIRSGVNESRGEFVLIFAADEVGPVLAIEDMLALAREEGCDFVSCTRYAHGGRRLGGHFLAGILSRLANRILHSMIGSPFTDCTTGIKLFRRTVFEKMKLQAKPVGWAVTFEMALKAQLLQLKLGEVPIISIDRLFGGVSTFRLGSWTWEYLRWFWFGVWTVRPFMKECKEEIKVKLPSFGVFEKR